MGRGLVTGVAEGFELERRVLDGDGEVLGDAGLQPVALDVSGKEGHARVRECAARGQARVL